MEYSTYEKLMVICHGLTAGMKPAGYYHNPADLAVAIEALPELLAGHGLYTQRFALYLLFTCLLVFF